MFGTTLTYWMGHLPLQDIEVQSVQSSSVNICRYIKLLLALDMYIPQILLCLSSRQQVTHDHRSTGTKKVRGKTLIIQGKTKT